MVKWADPFPDTYWEKKLCKYAGYKFPLSTHHLPIQYQFVMPAGWCSFSNDTDEAECDLFLLMGGDAQGVSVCSGISAQKRKKKGIQNLSSMVLPASVDACAFTRPCLPWVCMLHWFLLHLIEGDRKMRGNPQTGAILSFLIPLRF